MKFGLPEKSYQALLAAIKSFAEIESAEVFGSRAVDNYKSGSDVDIVLKGGKVTPYTVFALSALLNEQLPIPYYFDILSYQDINNHELKEHIDQCGQPLKF
ncbi:MAG: nucleotidyltransferase domain-containing protein [Desulfuromonadales bacterium]|nr:nucleotidyltransferase domain-containing protein [Desulfuromonadales bacterium]